MLNSTIGRLLTSIVSCFVFATAAANLIAAAPTPTQALKFKPVQSGVDYDQPDAARAKQCTVKPEKVKGRIAWVVRDASGVVLRRFTDTNGDKVVDRWSYYRDGIEVYRDIDSNYNGKADQYRWCQTAGTRWGIDKDEDGDIETWKVIAPEEVAEEVVSAVRSRSTARFARLLLTAKEATFIGLSAAQRKEIQTKAAGAEAAFRILLKNQKAISAKTEFVDFGGTRPGTIPAGTEGTTKDITVYENVAAFIVTDGEHDQLALGTMIRVGGAWKLLGAPSLGDSSDTNSAGQFFFAAKSNRPTRSPAASTNAPSEIESKLMSELEKVDREASAASGTRRASLNDRRADLLEKLAEATKDPKQRAQWINQLADTLSAEAQSGAYPNGIKRLNALQKKLAKQKGQAAQVAHVVYRRLAAEYGLSLQAPKANFAKIQTKWLENLEAYTKKYPTSADAADALMQLGMAEEFAGESDKAVSWYQRAATRFPKSSAAAKAIGALRRLGCVGKSIEVRGPAVGGGTVDLAEYRGKVVLIQYWATWCEPCKVDMARLKELHSKYAGRGFAILGVSLDHSKSDANAYLKENRVGWKSLFEPGGLDSRPANEMGILTLPTMLLVDKKGRVISRNIQVAELSNVLKTQLD